MGREGHGVPADATLMPADATHPASIAADAIAALHATQHPDRADKVDVSATETSDTTTDLDKANKVANPKAEKGLKKAGAASDKTTSGRDKARKVDDPHATDGLTKEVDDEKKDDSKS